MAECRICLGRHDPEIHQATLAVHEWLRSRLLRPAFEAPRPSKRTKPKPFEIPHTARYKRFREEAC